MDQKLFGMGVSKRAGWRGMPWRDNKYDLSLQCQSGSTYELFEQIRAWPLWEKRTLTEAGKTGWRKRGGGGGGGGLYWVHVHHLDKNKSKKQQQQLHNNKINNDNIIKESVFLHLLLILWTKKYKQKFGRNGGWGGGEDRIYRGWGGDGGLHGHGLTSPYKVIGMPLV